MKTLLCAGFCALIGSTIFAEVLDRKTVVITPRRIERGKPRAAGAVEIFFAEGSAKLSKAARRSLRALQIPAGAHVQIFGHANASGSRAYNKNLSRQRAIATRNYLKRRQPNATYRYRAYGKENPAYSNRTKAGYRLNRRVVVRIAMQ